MTMPPLPPGMLQPLPPPSHVMSSNGTGDTATGNYHPEFMFCGMCATCQEPDQVGKGEQNEDQLESDFRNVDLAHDDDDSVSADGRNNPILRSKFDLEEPISGHSQMLVIQALLRALPGVTKVYIQQKTNRVTVHHDTRASTEIMLAALESGGHDATLRDQEAPTPNLSNAEGTLPITTLDDCPPVWVRSEFKVEGICCTSEVPIVRDIVKPMSGVSKLQINITTRVVYVEHDLNLVTANDIATRLSYEGFPAQVKKNGAATVSSTLLNTKQNQGQAKLHIRGNLKPQEVVAIEQRFNQMSGVSRVSVNASDGIIYVDHDINKCTPLQCVEELLQFEEGQQMSLPSDLQETEASFVCTSDCAATSTCTKKSCCPTETSNASCCSKENSSKNCCSKGACATNNNAVSVVQSHFAVEGICCSSEIPFIQEIVEPMSGVSELQIDVEAKVVSVKHDENIISAKDIASELSGEGFPAQIKIKQDNNVTTIAVSSTPTVATSNGSRPVSVRSEFAVGGFCCSSEVPFIREIVEPIPGVSDLQINVTTKAVYAQHDVNLVSAKDIASKLTDEGFPTKVKKDGATKVTAPKITINTDSVPLSVRSEFKVGGICCASEVPIVREIVEPIPGVTKVQVNVTTKVVYVQYDVNVASANDIASKLTKEGFPAKIKRDGATAIPVASVSMNKTYSKARTILHVQGNLTGQDVGSIEKHFNQMKGAYRVSVIVNENAIHVDHDLYQITSLQCIEQLQKLAREQKRSSLAPSKTNHVYICEVFISGDGKESANGDDGNDAIIVSVLDSIGRSRYVESTLAVQGLESHSQLKMVEEVVSHNFDRDHVRAIYPNVMSRTIKVEHDPALISIHDICKTIIHDYNNNGALHYTDRMKEHLSVIVAINGADLKIYLPEEDSEGKDDSYNEAFGDNGDFLSSMRLIHTNVFLSGIFWFVSILSLRGGSWENLQYVGLLSVFFGLPPIMVKAFRTLRRKQFDSNCMMVTAAVGAVALQEYDEAASVSFLFAVSELLEARATRKARKALSEIVNLRPDHANVIHPYTKEIVVVPAEKVPVGSLISVKTGDKIAADGVVVEGSSSVDESSLTGESRPAHKNLKDTVRGGTINIGTSQLVVKTTTAVEDSAVSRLIRLVEEAQACRSPTEKVVDTFARSYTPSVVFAASFLCTVPWLWGAEVGRYWTLNGLILIVIACPCALTISTPVTYAAGLAATAQRGIIIKGGAKLEAMGSVEKIVFDKTGTLTQGKFSVMNLEVIGHTKSRKEMLELLSLLQGRSSHPLSLTLVQEAKKEGIKVPTNISISDHTVLKGEGVTARINGITNVYCGNQRLFERLGMYQKLENNYKTLVQSWASTGGTIGFLGTDQAGVIGAFCVKDAVRPEARAVLHHLKHDMNIEASLCTGDSHTAAHAAASEIGMPMRCVHSQLLPEDKLHFVGSLKRPAPITCALCRKKRHVLFCGDGVNDAPALAVADIGVSMGEGAAMAMEMSDVTLMDSNLTKLSYAIHMGRRVLSTVQENIFISLVSKVIVVGLSFAGKMTLLLAIASDVGIMLAVTLNGMKLLPSRSVDINTDVTLRTRQKESKSYHGVDSKDVDLVEMTSTPKSSPTVDEFDDDPEELEPNTRLSYLV